MGSSSISTTKDMDDSRNNSVNLAQSPISHDNPYPSSPSTSTGYGYHANSLPLPTRSATDQQIPVSPKPVHSQQQQQHHTPPPSQQLKSSMSKQSSVPTPKPVVSIQHRKFYMHIFD